MIWNTKDICDESQYCKIKRRYIDFIQCQALTIFVNIVKLQQWIEMKWDLQKGGKIGLVLVDCWARNIHLIQSKDLHLFVWGQFEIMK